MDDKQKTLLETKKHEVKLRLRVDDFIKNHLINWLKIYQIILTNGIEHELVQLANVKEEEIPFWEKAMVNEPFSKLNFNLEKLNTVDEKNLFIKLYNTFPSAYPLRFMPSEDMPTTISASATENLINYAAALAIETNDDVYLMYLYYSPVLKLKLKDIIAYSEQLFDFPMEDIVITSLDFHKTIFRSMEDEWRFCRSTTIVS